MANTITNLEALRRLNGWPASMLAKKVGVHSATVKNWEKGKGVKKQVQIDKLLEIFPGWTIEALLSPYKQEKAAGEEQVVATSGPEELLYLAVDHMATALKCLNLADLDDTFPVVAKARKEIFTRKHQIEMLLQGNLVG